MKKVYATRLAAVQKMSSILSVGAWLWSPGRVAPTPISAKRQARAIAADEVAA